MPADRYLPMSDAPQDGTEIIGLVEGEEVPMRWCESRHCSMAGYAGGHGYFGPGWGSVPDALIIGEPESWRPMEAGDAG